MHMHLYVIILASRHGSLHTMNTQNKLTFFVSARILGDTN